MKYLPSIVLMLSLVGCAQSETRQEAAQVKPTQTKPADTLVTVSKISVQSTDFIKMQMNSDKAYITMADSVIPSEADPTIGICVEAAFTGELLPEFKSSNVAGNYVIDGELHKGYKCKANTGFLYADKSTFVISSSQHCSKWIKKAQTSKGCLFQQMLLVNDGANVYRGKPIKSGSSNIYRSACIMEDGSFAVIQSKTALPLAQFINSLIAMGVKDALYLDMGVGWNFGWYRTTTASAPVRLFNYKSEYQTNWLVVKSRE